MLTCKDCKNFQPHDEVSGYCLAAEGKIVESDREIEDCLAGAFEPRENE